jgi:peptidoglycan/LPS O-acetylase OafA/YrhL
MADPATSPDRRLDLDWLRIAAFGILIFYHVGMFYVSWDWHVKSSRAGPAIEPLMMLVNPWRLTLLFIISGAATRFMADKTPTVRLLVSRMGRLWPPLILAVLVVVPPQSYFEVVEQAAYRGGFLDFYPRYLTASGGWCDADGCLITPTYNHMWFVAYLILYTLVLVALLPLLRRAPKWPSVLIAGPGLFLTPWLFLAALRLILAPVFGQTHELWNDGYLHPLYFGAFLFGFFIARHDRFFADCERYRYAALVLAVAAYAYTQVSRLVIGDGARPDWFGPAWQAAHELHAWAAMLAAFGFAHRHLRGTDTPLRRYLAEAIFPFYLLHQTIIVVAGHFLDALGLPLGLEASLLVALTTAGCFATYEVARRSGPLRRWFGIRPKGAEGSGAGRLRLAPRP